MKVKGKPQKKDPVTEGGGAFLKGEREETSNLLLFALKSPLDP